MKKQAMAAAFAHLLGRAGADSNPDDEEDKKKSRRAEGDDDDQGDDPDRAPKDPDGDGDDDRRDGRKSKRAKKAKGRAEDGDDDPDAEDGDDNPDAEGDEDDQGAEDESDREKSARRAERKRCAAIFNCAAAGVRPDMAAHLAFNTSMSAKSAISMLKVAAQGDTAGSRMALSERMSGVKTARLGGSDDSSSADMSSPKAQAAQIAALTAKVRGN